MYDLLCAVLPSSLSTWTVVSSPWISDCASSVARIASYSRDRCSSAGRMIQCASVPRLTAMFERPSASSMRYSGVPSAYFAVITVAIIAGLALLPGSGCMGMGAITMGVCSAWRSQWRHAYLKCTCCSTDAFTSMCNCSHVCSPIRCIAPWQHGQTFWSPGRSYSIRVRGRSAGSGLRPRFWWPGASTAGRPVSGSAKTPSGSSSTGSATAACSASSNTRSLSFSLLGAKRLSCARRNSSSSCSTRTFSSRLLASSSRI
ncbi:hypothetical protein LMG28138_06064 [Pararobbsia alpina]|uniref:Uncharacterized protein n=1 Tax=Pararobbsia alpina TaxID=621374 RepID=A0A6S7BPT0_9BURK|nr:hypothetical protein LMG28138_06064 [Pararobbsia alpina]